jgi:hypothetical protein
MADDIEIDGDIIRVSGAFLEKLHKLARLWGVSPHEALGRAVREVASERRESGSVA